MRACCSPVLRGAACLPLPTYDKRQPTQRQGEEVSVLGDERIHCQPPLRHRLARLKLAHLQQQPAGAMHGTCRLGQGRLGQGRGSAATRSGVHAPRGRGAARRGSASRSGSEAACKPACGATAGLPVVGESPPLTHHIWVQPGGEGVKCSLPDSAASAAQVVPAAGGPHERAGGKAQTLGRMRWACWA